MLEGGAALLSAEALLMDMGIHFEEKLLVSDSTSALSISEGSCSWRTRHLRIRAQWLHEQILTGSINVVPCPGERLVADLLTKPLSSARLRSLLRLWGMDLGDAADEPAAEQQPAASTHTSQHTRVISSGPSIIKALVSLLALLQVRESDGMEVVPNYEELAPRGLAVDRTLLTSTWVLSALLCLVVAWECLKWIVVNTSRRARRLARLRDRAEQVAQREIRRLQEDDDIALLLDQGDPTAKSRASAGRRSLQGSSSSSRAAAADQQSLPAAREAELPPRAETIVRGLYSRRHREPPTTRAVQTDPWQPEVVERIVEVPVRVEVPIEVPSRRLPMFGESDFQPVVGDLLATQHGEHVHLNPECTLHFEPQWSGLTYSRASYTTHWPRLLKAADC